MLRESPLDLRKDIQLLKEAIDSCGHYSTVTRAILCERLRMMRNGTGFSGSFTSVSQFEKDEWTKEMEETA